MNSTTIKIDVEPKNKLMQIKKHKKLANAGAVVELLLNLKEAKKILREIEKGK